MVTLIGRVITFAFQNFWRNIWLSVITVSMLVLTLLSVNVLLVLQVLGNTAVRSVEERIDVTASFVPTVSDEVVGEVRSYLATLPQVTETRMITPEEALESFKARHANNPSILRSLEEVGENPFGPTLVIRARTTQDYSFILEALENPTYREFIQDKNFTDHEAIISRINQITERLRRFGLALAILFGSIAVLIIMNTIRVAIYTYREEIGIMKLVGASNWFVRAPFLIESVLYSVVATAITVAIVLPVTYFIEPQVQQFFEGTTVGLSVFFTTRAVPVFGAELGLLSASSVLFSALAVGKYLKT